MDLEKLIDAVRSHPCIYDPIHTDHKVTLKRENAWKAVKQAVGPGFTVEDCMKRFKSLRERFVREKKKRTKKSSDAADNTPVWPYYDLLFLKDVVKHRNTSGNVVKDEDNFDEEDPLEADLQPLTPTVSTTSTGSTVAAPISTVTSTTTSNNSSTSTPVDRPIASTSIKPSVKQARTASQDRHGPTKKKRGSEEVIDLDKVLMKEILNTKEDDEDGHFGASVAASLRKMESKKKMLAKIKIQQALFEVECCNTPTFSSIATHNTPSWQMPHAPPGPPHPTPYTHNVNTGQLHGSVSLPTSPSSYSPRTSQSPYNTPLTSPSTCTPLTSPLSDTQYSSPLSYYTPQHTSPQQSHSVSTSPQFTPHTGTSAFTAYTNASPLELEDNVM